MYEKSARLYDALYEFKDYERQSEELKRLFGQLHPSASDWLDVACGTGKHLAQLSDAYHVEGLDLNKQLLEIARKRCPGIMFHEADMVSYDLTKKFDIITILFSSIGYVRSVDRLNRTLENIARHLRPNGVAIIEPWFYPDTYWTNTITANFVNKSDLKIAWMYTSTRRDNLSVLDMHYMVGTSSGIEVFTELHEIGLFTDDEYRSAFTASGLTVEHSDQGPSRRGMYVGRHISGLR